MGPAPPPPQDDAGDDKKKKRKALRKKDKVCKAMCVKHHATHVLAIATHVCIAALSGQGR